MILTQEQRNLFEKAMDQVRRDYKETTRDGYAVILNGYHFLVAQLGGDPFEMELHALAEWIDWNLPRADKITVEELIRLAAVALEQLLVVDELKISEKLNSLSNIRVWNNSAKTYRESACSIMQSELPKTLGFCVSRYLAGVLLLGSDNSVVAQWRSMIARTEQAFIDLAGRHLKNAEDADERELNERLSAFAPWTAGMVKKPTNKDMGVCKRGGTVWYVLQGLHGQPGYTDTVMLDLSKPPYSFDKFPCKANYNIVAEKTIPDKATVVVNPMWQTVSGDMTIIILSDGEEFFPVQQKYFNHFMSNYKDVSFLVVPDCKPDRAICTVRVTSKGKTVGAVKPVLIHNDMRELLRILLERQMEAVRAA